MTNEPLVDQDGNIITDADGNELHAIPSTTSNGYATVDANGIRNINIASDIIGSASMTSDASVTNNSESDVVATGLTVTAGHTEHYTNIALTGTGSIESIASSENSGSSDIIVSSMNIVEMYYCLVLVLDHVEVEVFFA